VPASPPSPCPAKRGLRATDSRQELRRINACTLGSKQVSQPWRHSAGMAKICICVDGDRYALTKRGRDCHQFLCTTAVVEAAQAETPSLLRAGASCTRTVYGNLATTEYDLVVSFEYLTWDHAECWVELMTVGRCVRRLFAIGFVARLNAAADCLRLRKCSRSLRQRPGKTACLRLDTSRHTEDCSDNSSTLDCLRLTVASSLAQRSSPTCK
jgi:hypothetical protein